MNFFTIILDILRFENLLMMNIGMAAGILIGVLPGLGMVLAVTLLLPFTFGMEALAGVFLLLGTYCGAAYGGSISAILINTPGTPNAVVTAMEGYPMTQNGKAMDGLSAALYGSTFGGLVSCLALMLIAPMIATAALKFGPAEFFALAVFGICVVTSVTGKNVYKAFIMGGLGLLISTIGMDSVNGTSRFIFFGRLELAGGISVAVAALGLFAISEIMSKARKLDENVIIDTELNKSNFTILECLKRFKVLITSSVVGIIIGAIPGTGGGIASFLSHNLSRNFTKEKETYGKGNIDGLLAGETANNAVTGSALIPLLTLGIPGDVVMAILFGALMMQGITPGPDLFTTNKEWVWTLMGGLILINLFMLVQGKLFIRAFSKITKVPSIIIIPAVMIFVMLGAYGINNRLFDVVIVLVIGFFAYFLIRFEFPIAPLTIGIVLGQIAEANMRRALQLSEGSISIFFTRPISLALLVISVLSLALPIINGIWKRSKDKKHRVFGEDAL